MFSSPRTTAKRGIDRVEFLGKYHILWMHYGDMLIGPLIPFTERR